MNVAWVPPAAMVTETGTTAAFELLDIDTARPPTGAALEITTVPVEDVRPVTVVGLKDTEVNDGALIVNVAVSTDDPRVAVIVAVVCAATAPVFTVNVVDVLPDATVTLEGSVACGELLSSLIVSPFFGAGPVSDIDPVEDAPPSRLVGLRLKDCRTAGWTTSDAVKVNEFNIAFIVTDDTADTA